MNFVRRDCKGRYCDNWIEIKESLIKDFLPLYDNWICSECGRKNHL